MTIDPTGPASWNDLLAHRAWLQRLARRLARDQDQAEDLEQEVWLRAARTPEPRAPRGWLATVLRRVAVDRWRAQRRMHDQAAVGGAVADPAPSAEAQAMRAEVHEQVRRAVLALPEPYRSTVLLRYVADLPIAEVARRQEVPLETARTRLRRGLSTLRARLDVEHGGAGRWLAALAPWTGTSATGAATTIGAGGAATAAAGGVVMGKMLFVVGGIALAVCGYLLWGAEESTPPTDGSGGAEVARVRTGESRTTPVGTVPALQGTSNAGAAETPARTADTPPEDASGIAAAPRDPGPAEVLVRVVDRDGRDVEARVVLEGIGAEGRFVAVPDAAPAPVGSGWVSYDRLEEGQYRVAVYAAGFLTIRRPVVPGRTPVLVELERALLITGRVEDEATGEPVGGLVVSARPAASPWAGTGHVATTLPDGTFRIDALPEGSYVVTVQRNDGVADDWIRKELGVVEAGTEDLVIQVERGYRIAGVLRDPDGLPVTTPLPIEAIRITDHGGLDYAHRVTVHSDEEGRFLFAGLPRGRYDLTFEPPQAGGSQPSIAATALQGIPAGTTDLVVDLVEGLSIRGRLVDADGETVEVPGTIFVHPMGTVAGSQESVAVPVLGGTFETPALVYGRSYRILATGFPGYRQGTLTDVRPGSTDLVIPLEAGGSIRGRVLDEQGRPVPAGVGVLAVGEGSAGEAARGVGYTLHGGTFVVEMLGPHTFTLTAGGAASSYVPAGKAQHVEPGTEDVVLRVKRGAEISGRLVDASGNPVGTHLLGGFSQGGDGYMQAWTSADAEEGRFTLKGIREGPVRLSAYLGGRFVQLGTFTAPAKDLVVTVPED